MVRVCRGSLSARHIVVFGSLIVCALVLITSRNNLSPPRDASAHLRLPNAVNRKLVQDDIDELDDSVNAVVRSPILFVDVYSEQIGRSVNNFARLLTLSKKMGRRLVEPFVHGSRLSGMERRDISTPQAFSHYFDLRALNRLLRRRGIVPLASYQDMFSACPHGWDLVLLIQNQDVSLSRPELGSVRNRKKDVTECRKAAESSADGYAECPVLVRMARLLPEQRQALKNKRRAARQSVGNSVPARGIVISAAKFHSISKLNELMKDSQCASLQEWAGEGDRRAEFSDLTPTDMQSQVRPYELYHSEFIKGKAREFAAEHLSAAYISVHLRMEKAIKLGQNMQQLKKCVRSVAEAVAKLVSTRTGGANRGVFLATDLGEHGSDTLHKHIDAKNRAELLEYTQTTLKDAVIPTDFGLTDHGARAMVESEIAAGGGELIAVGGGNFQEWMSVLFRLHSGGKSATKMCLQTKVPPGWELQEPR
ncbi:uncharacterized protein LOC135819215 [Sycon ciliatum]|uniref:uncharacterized protein LOC135819215 n=1 Tax=Sycon ciliatum TaxID=27933 RepID=UPI0031F67D2C